MTALDKCGARTRSQGTCGRPAGWGTDHPGYGRCKLHGGKTPNGNKYAERQLAEQEVKAFGLPVDVGPQEAITQELHRTAGSVAWLHMIVQGMEQDRIVQGITKIENRTGFQPGRIVTVEGKPSVWVELWQSERRHLVQVSAAAHKMGIDTRQTALIETAGQMLAASIMRILDRLSLTDQQQIIAGEVVPEILMGLDQQEANADV